MHVFTHCQVKSFLFSVSALLLCAITGAKAQVVEHGREAARGTVNFTDAANYLLAHPRTEPRREAENEEEFENIPHVHPVITDTTQLRRRAAATSTGSGHTSYSTMSLLPTSYTASDTFESTLDPGFAIPPDTHGGVDSNYAVTTINTTVKVQTRAGGAVSSVTLDAFWTSVLPGGGAFDPRIHYDPYTNRWIFVAVSGGNDPSSSILLAVSQTSNPTGSWYLYKILAESTGTYWLDYPDVGFNGKWITVTGNLFGISGGSFGGAKVFAFDKATVMSGGGAPYTSFVQTSSATICPALTYSSTLQNMFMVETYWGGFAGGGQMHVWKLSGPVGSETMTSVGFPVSPNRWQGQSYDVTTSGGGDFAPQAGTANRIQTNDDRVNQVVFMNNRLWFAHTIFLPYSTTVDASRASIQWWQTDTTGTPIQVGLIDDNTNNEFYAFPSLIVNTNNDAFIGFSRMSATTFPSAAYALRLSTDPVDSIRPYVVYRHGQAKYYKTFSGTRNRFGDYSAAALDPLNMTDFWTIQEASATPSGSTDRWDTWWAYVKLCNPPAGITGATTVCPGSTTTLSDATSGGTWTSSNTSVATIGSGSGLVTGIAAGTVTITYAVGTGCYATQSMTVLTGPSSITGVTTLCLGGSSTLGGTPGGGTWISGNTSVATIGSASGVVTPVAVGNSIVTYTLSNGCTMNTTVTINNTPSAITGTTALCVGATSSLGSSPAGGVWSSSNLAVASVGSTGIVTGLASGTANISYTIGSCAAGTTVTINPAPAAIGGATSLCVGGSTTLTDASGAGTWTSSNTAVATIGSTTGTVTALSAGTTNIVFTLNSTGCTISRTETVNPTPAAITGSMLVCPGATTSLSNTVPGGVWTSGNTAIATVGTGTGTVTGISSGTANITYAIGTCQAVATVTVDIAPAAITGIKSVCVGNTTILSDASGGGTWTSGNTAVATIGSTSGTVTGVSAGTANITYSTGTSCNAITTVTVNTSPGPITGTPNVCPGSTTALGNSIGGGTWTSGNTAVATITSSGVVTGVTSGTSNITYSLGAGCQSILTVTVDVGPSAITGTTTVCSGATTTLGNATGGGTWSSSNTAVATVGSSSGTVTGVTGGTAIITYSTGVSCIATTTVTVITSPGAITGTTTLCSGTTTALGNSVGGGTWSSSNTAVATVSVSGVVTGVSGGTATITYTTGGSCTATTLITVNTTPAPISGSTAICISATATLTDATGGGTWSSSNPAVASIGSSTGVVTGVAAGSATITYAIGSCYVTMGITVSSSPGAITGAVTICDGTTSTLSDATLGGTWTSSNTAVVTIGSSSGIATAVSPGSATITYSLGGSCVATTMFNVNSLPAPIAGTTTICELGTTALTDATSGGTWSSSNALIASVGTLTGVVTGVSAGSATITYRLATGCVATALITVNPIPAAITGLSSVCVGSTTTLSSATSSGVWSSSDPIVASIVSGTGDVTGITAGSVTITYQLGTGCKVTTPFTVNPLPASIAGTTSVCVGASTTLSDATSGGTWSSGSTSVATIGATTGVVNGLSVGTSSITYTLGTGCKATTTVTVSTVTAATISGPSAVCVGQTITLTDPVPGGTWSSSSSTATVGASTGIVTGITAGSAVISYSVTNGCGTAVATQTITINALPSVAPISGTLAICTGGSVLFTDATSSGVWSSGNPAVATVSSTGTVTGISPGTAPISYTVTSGTGCSSNAIVTTTVSAPPSITITPSGPTSFCRGGSVLLTATAISGYTYQWKLGGVPIAGATTTSYLDSVSGSVTVTISGSGGCTATSSAIVVTVSSSFAVVPSVSITAVPGTVLCLTSSTVNFTANPVNGGSAPVYQWYVNGVPSGTASTFSYTPSDGDVVKVRLTSNDPCAFPDTAITSVTMTVTLPRTPTVSITPSPNDSICAGTRTTFFAMPTNGGTAPTYVWTVNGSTISGASSNTYSYTPANGDIVLVTLNSNYPCVSSTTATSTAVVMHVDPIVTNTLSITVAHSSIGVGQADTFTAVAPNGGAAPVFQWYIDGTAVVGATGPVFVTTALTDGQTVSAAVTSSEPCADPATALSNGIRISVSTGVTTQIKSESSFTLVPNPNKGTFTLRGTVKGYTDDKVTISVTDVLGQEVHKQSAKLHNGSLEEHIELSNTLASGMYLVKITAGDEHVVLHVVVNR